MNLPLAVGRCADRLFDGGTRHVQVQQERIQDLGVTSTLGSRPAGDAQEAASSNGAALAPVEPPSDEQHILLFYATGELKGVQMAPVMLSVRSMSMCSLPPGYQMLTPEAIAGMQAGSTPSCTTPFGEEPGRIHRSDRQAYALLSSPPLLPRFLRALLVQAVAEGGRTAHPTALLCRCIHPAGSGVRSIWPSMGLCRARQSPRCWSLC